MSTGEKVRGGIKTMEQKEQIEQIEKNISELVESDLTNTDSTEPDNPNTDVAEPNLHATHDTETERESQPNSDHLSAAEQAAADWTPTPEKRGPGRPWGRKNKPKHVRGVSEYLENSATEDERRHWERGTAIVTVDQLNTYINMAGGMSIESMAKRINDVDASRKNARYANFVLAIAAIGRGADRNDVNDLRMRFYAYVELAAQTNNKLSNMNAYMSMGLTATKVSQLMQHGTQEQKDLLEEVKMICGGYRESLMSDGQLTPSTGMFWQKNYDGLRDATEHIVVPGDPLGEMRSKREIQEKYADIIME